MIAITVDAARLQMHLSEIGSGIEDMTRPIEKVLEMALSDSVEAIFAQGPGWFPMAASTQKRGRDPNTLLFETGGLMDSLKRGTAGNVFMVEPHEGVAGTSYRGPRSSYAIGKWQQEGTRGGVLPGIPARPFLYWREDKQPSYLQVFRDRVQLLLDEGITEGVGGPY